MAYNPNYNNNNNNPNNPNQPYVPSVYVPGQSTAGKIPVAVVASSSSSNQGGVDNGSRNPAMVAGAVPVASYPQAGGYNYNNNNNFGGYGVQQHQQQYPPPQPTYNSYPSAGGPGMMPGGQAAVPPHHHQPQAIMGSSGNHGEVFAPGPTGGLVSEGDPVKCHKVDYEIKGHEMQLVEIELDTDETVIAEAGAMMFIEDGIEFKVKLGDGSEPKQGFFAKIMSAGGRIMTGESLFLTHFKNKGTHGQKARVAFAAPYPGTIIPVNMQNISGQSLICQKDAFLCAAKGTKLSMHFHKKIGSGLFGGEGFILQKLQGDGMAFIHAGGAVIRRELNGERIRLDTGCLVAFTEGINYDITFVPGLKSIFFGGEGLFLATLQGHGTIWMQSLPFSRMADRILANAPSAGGHTQGEGTPLTGQLGQILAGDGMGGALNAFGGF